MSELQQDVIEPDFESSFNVAFDDVKMRELAIKHKLINENTPPEVIAVIKNFTQDFVFHTIDQIIENN